MENARSALSGYVRVAAATPCIRVADCAYNAGRILALMEKAVREEVRLLCLPELCLTGYTCGDLFLQDTLLRGAEEALAFLVEKSADFPLLVVAGTPFVHGGKLFNTAAVFGGGELLGLVPKTHLPNYNEFYELRHFSPAPADFPLLKETCTVRFAGRDVPLGTRLLFRYDPGSGSGPRSGSGSAGSGFCVAVEICEDLWIPVPPSSFHAMAGASIIVNPSASDEVVGKPAYRRALVAAQSARLVCGYVYADAGRGESSTDMVFAGHNFICENGEVLAESPPFGDGWAATEIDLYALEYDRRRLNTFECAPALASTYTVVPFSLGRGVETPWVETLTRPIEPHPFVPKDAREKRARCEAILDMQSAGLEKRLEHARARTAVLGISGGLDSCLALLVTVRAMKRLGRPLSDICAATMPCFGTTARTKTNARRLSEALGVDCREIDITESVRAHLRDIGHSEDVQDVVYENAQARVRTLTLMDLANRTGGIVVGTGDLSELALGWATYNGDHMSMYGVNAGVPKTLVRHIVQHAAETAAENPFLREVLEDILATPVSPELLPSSGDDIRQQTEDLVGPYELHDFFLYHAVRWGRSPAKIHALSLAAFAGTYGPETVLKWLEVFYRRFFAQQFKRSCLPDGPKIGSVSLSPRSDWRMPSDASCEAWLKELAALTEWGARG
ncbi:MAG: NAD(+) synthase [Synergistaceae bacterium]|jgi:NAD+ synthase (glutamine-hydrolysing)|nr:NAD(+) synthase [Synergistaceae bacterium]